MAATLWGAAGMALTLTTLALIACDVVISAHPVEAAVGGAVKLAVGVGGASLGELVATAAAAGMDAAPGKIVVAGICGMLGGAVMVGALVPLHLG